MSNSLAGSVIKQKLAHRGQADIVLLHRFAKAAQSNLVRVKFPWPLL
jgi:hypothetical protein